jgi:hypothetical protein
MKFRELEWGDVWLYLCLSILFIFVCCGVNVIRYNETSQGMTSSVIQNAKKNRIIARGRLMAITSEDLCLNVL